MSDLKSRFTPSDILNQMQGALGAQETRLNQRIDALGEKTDQATLLKLQVDFQQYLQSYNATSAITKAIHDTQSDIIRKF
ncbi:MAG: EscF/YscF/HrpA family type III secretion system needle major subunit [Janthinobacterium lividum]